VSAPSVFVVLLRLAEKKSLASSHLAAHNAWLARGFEDGAFLVAGTLVPKLGGAIIAHGITHAELEARVALDPFVAYGVVASEILEVDPAKVDPRVAFLLM
jgi:uncharacterized protein YciI